LTQQSNMYKASELNNFKGIYHDQDPFDDGKDKFSAAFDANDLIRRLNVVKLQRDRDSRLEASADVPGSARMSARNRENGGSRDKSSSLVKKYKSYSSGKKTDSVGPEDRPKSSLNNHAAAAATATTTKKKAPNSTSSKSVPKLRLNRTATVTDKEKDKSPVLSKRHDSARGSQKYGYFNNANVIQFLRTGTKASTVKKETHKRNTHHHQGPNDLGKASTSKDLQNEYTRSFENGSQTKTFYRSKNGLEERDLRGVYGSNGGTLDKKRTVRGSASSKKLLGSASHKASKNSKFMFRSSTDLEKTRGRGTKSRLQHGLDAKLACSKSPTVLDSDRHKSSRGSPDRSSDVRLKYTKTLHLEDSGSGPSSRYSSRLKSSIASHSGMANATGSAVGSKSNGGTGGSGHSKISKTFSSRLKSPYNAKSIYSTFYNIKKTKSGSMAPNGTTATGGNRTKSSHQVKREEKSIGKQQFTAEEVKAKLQNFDMMDLIESPRTGKLRQKWSGTGTGVVTLEHEGDEFDYQQHAYTEGDELLRPQSVRLADRYE